MQDVKDPHSFADNRMVDIIGIIRRLRNELIQDFLMESNLLDYWASLYKSRELSGGTRKLIYEELKRLLQTPVNMQHYAPLLEKFRRTGRMSLTGENDTLFYGEMEAVLDKFAGYTCSDKE